MSLPAAALSLHYESQAHDVAKTFDFIGGLRGCQSGGDVFVLDGSLRIGEALCKPRPALLRPARFGGVQGQMAARLRAIGWQESQNGVYSGMIWSKLRAKVRANLCNELKDRMDFHVAVYRKSHDSKYGRAWISLDGRQIGSWSCFEQHFHRIRIEDLRNRFPHGWTGLQYDRFVAEQGVYSREEFKRLLTEYLASDPHTALTSTVPLTRILAVSDRRIGRRALARFPVDQETDPIVRMLWHFRVQSSQSDAAPHNDSTSPDGF